MMEFGHERGRNGSRGHYQQFVNQTTCKASAANAAFRESCETACYSIEPAQEAPAARIQSYYSHGRLYPENPMYNGVDDLCTDINLIKRKIPTPDQKIVATNS
jgi:hypothetical protein